MAGETTSQRYSSFEMSGRDGAIVAWHEVPGKAPPQKSRPVGYGMIRAFVQVCPPMIARTFRREIPLGLAASDHTVPFGTAVSFKIRLRSEKRCNLEFNSSTFKGILSFRCFVIF